MSADEFDPGIERLFNRAPVMADAAEFDAKVMGRLNSGNRTRGFVLSLAGIIGGCVAVKEAVGMNFRLGGGQFQASTMDSEQAVEGVVRDGGRAFQGLVDSVGLGGLDMAHIGQTQTFLGVVAVLITLLTLGAVKLYQQV